MKVIFFPGQGSQFKGMGKTLFSAYPQFTSIASNILGYSIEELCVQDTHQQLFQTNYTQPALYVVNALLYYEQATQIDTVDFFAGHSLGEYNALLAAGAFDFETGLKLVQKRGELMSQAEDGGMLAILGSSVEEIQAILLDNQLNTLDIANYNTPTQNILSGPKEDIIKAGMIFTKAKIRCTPLKVSAAFHSRYMQKAKEEFEKFLTSFQFNPLKIPVIANVTAQPYQNNQIATLLTSQIIGSVLWNESIRYLMSVAEARQQKFEFIEMSEKPVLAKMVLEIQEKQSNSALPTESCRPQASTPLQPVFKTVQISAEQLGNAEFKKEYGTKYAYVSGAMYKGISSKELVIAMGKAGFMSFLGTGGMDLRRIESDLRIIQHQLNHGEPYGMNLLCNLSHPEIEMSTVEIYLKHHVRHIEAASFMYITPALVWYRVSGLEKTVNGGTHIKNRIMAKVSRPEVAEMFMSPPPARLVATLFSEGRITAEQAELAQHIPMSNDICVEADSGGHTTQGVSTVLLPSVQSLRNTVMKQYHYKKNIRVGLAGGIGTPQAIAAAFIMGADFVLTGSINQCTVEAGTSDSVKNLLQDINVQDTGYAPAGDMFEIGGRIQVLKKGIFFPTRANKLHALYTQYHSLEEIPLDIKMQIEEKYFKRSFESIWQETVRRLESKGRQQELQQIEAHPKRKMAKVFRWYFYYSTMLALNGDETQRVDYQVHTGPALGAFNQWVKGTTLENWRNRRVAEISSQLMCETAKLLEQQLNNWTEY